MRNTRLKLLSSLMAQVAGIPQPRSQAHARLMSNYFLLTGKLAL